MSCSILRFEDGTIYRGESENALPHGRGVLDGLPEGCRFYGLFVGGSQRSGVYTWPGGETYSGRWHNGNRHGVGVEKKNGVVYCGEWVDDVKGKNGVMLTEVGGKYEGMWSSGLQNGFGVEIYADVGRYEGQWTGGKRNGYGVRVKTQTELTQSHSAAKPHSQLDVYSMDRGQCSFSFEEAVAAVENGGVLKASDSEVRAAQPRRKSLAKLRLMFVPSGRGRLRSQESVNAGIYEDAEMCGLSSTEPPVGCFPWSIGSHNEAKIAPDVSDYCCYKGEWSDDQRCGYGVCDLVDGYVYRGSWERNTLHGYGRLEHQQRRQWCQQGKWENGQLVQALSSSGLKKLLVAQLQANVAEAVRLASQAATTADEKAKLALSKSLVAREKCTLAKVAAVEARNDAQQARQIADGYTSTGHLLAEKQRPPLVRMQAVPRPRTLQRQNVVDLAEDDELVQQLCSAS